jgi:hypothetical protein
MANLIIFISKNGEEIPRNPRNFLVYFSFSEKNTRRIAKIRQQKKNHYLEPIGNRKRI